jgi:NTE family protein
LTNRTVGLALSSGGARGLAHIGVIKVLAEENIPIDMIAGTSAGALFGALHAVGWSYEQILTYIQDLKSLTEFRNWDFTPPRLSGIVRGRKAQNEFLARPLGDRTFEDLETPLYIVAADILTGEEVVFGSGPLIEATLADAIRASVSIPVLPDPWEYKGRYLVDGGMVNPLPASVLCDHGADIVIASSVIRPLRDSYAGSRDKMPHILQTISNIFTAMEAEIVKEQLPLIDILIPHNVSAKHTFDFDHAEELIRSGEEAARQMIPAIKERLEKPDEKA